MKTNDLVDFLFNKIKKVIVDSTTNTIIHDNQNIIRENFVIFKKILLILKQLELSNSLDSVKELLDPNLTKIFFKEKYTKFNYFICREKYILQEIESKKLSLSLNSLTSEIIKANNVDAWLEIFSKLKNLEMNEIITIFSQTDNFISENFGFVQKKRIKYSVFKLDIQVFVYFYYQKNIFDSAELENEISRHPLLSIENISTDLYISRLISHLFL